MWIMWGFKLNGNILVFISIIVFRLFSTIRRFWLSVLCVGKKKW